MACLNDFVELGQISGFFGVKGWLKLRSYTRPRTGISQYKTFYIGEVNQKPTERVSFSRIQPRGKQLIGYIDGIDSRDQAQGFIGKVLWMQSQDLPALQGEYYWHQLIGLTVTNLQGQVIGTIKRMMETGVNDVIVIANKSGGETLIPYIMSHFIVTVDLPKAAMVVDWPLDEDDD